MIKINRKIVYSILSIAILLTACESDDSGFVANTEKHEIITSVSVAPPALPASENISPVEAEKTVTTEKTLPIVDPARSIAKAVIRPIASAGAEQYTNVGTSVVLDGGASSSANKKPLQYRWTLTSKPLQSKAKLTTSKSVSPSFTVDQVGVYKATLVVNDGYVNSSPSTVTIHCGEPVLAFSNNSQSNTITTYAVDKRTGLLTDIAITKTELNPISMVLHPNQQYLYVAFLNTNTVSVFAIDKLTGSLSEKTSIAANAITKDFTSKPNFIYTDASAQFLYVANQVSNNLTGAFTTNVSVFDIEAVTGQLTAVSSVSPPLNNWSMGVHTNGRYAYIPSYIKNNISTYTINQDTGVLSELSSVATGFGPSSVSIMPNGNFVYSANFKNNTVSIFSVDPLTGVLSAQGSVQTGASETTGIKPLYIVIHPSGKFAYTANYGSGDISVFSVNQTSGELTWRNTVTSAISPATEITSLSFDPSGQFLYSMTPGSGIWIFSINKSSGELTEVMRKMGSSVHSLLFTDASPLNKKS